MTDAIRLACALHNIRIEPHGDIWLAFGEFTKDDLKACGVRTYYDEVGIVSFTSNFGVEVVPDEIPKPPLELPPSKSL